MKLLKQALWLAKKEIKYQWIGLVISMIATVLFGLMSAFVLDQSVRKVFGSEVMFYNNVLIDAIFLILIPGFGAIFMSAPYLNSFGTIKEDPYNKRMALYRSLPISVKVLAWSRTLVMLFTFIILTSTFYISLTIAAPDSLYQLLSTGQFLTFIFLWVGYGLAMGGMNPFFEYGTSGKILQLSPFIYLIVFLMIVLVLYNNFDYGIVDSSLLLIKNTGWVSALISMVIGVVGFFIWNRILTKRLENKDYL